MTTSPSDRRVERLLRDLAPQVLGAVVRRCGDFAASEDAVQEALIAAATEWPREGVPDNPRGWLIHVALRRMTDYVRSEIARRNREAVVADEHSFVVAPTMDSEPVLDPDDTLVLLFMCCHPALTPASAIALTLRAVGGLTTAEIAKAFLVPESTIGQRISRAKQSIRTSQIPFSMPDAAECAERVSSVLHVLYLVFNEGYTASAGDKLHRTDLSNEAIRLTREVYKLLPDNGEVAGLLALMLLTDARRTVDPRVFGRTRALVGACRRTRCGCGAVPRGCVEDDERAGERLSPDEGGAGERMPPDGTLPFGEGKACIVHGRRVKGPC